VIRLLPAPVLMLSLSPGAAWACSVCGAGDQETADAFLASTVFLSLLPLTVIFGGMAALWLHAGKPNPFAERPDPIQSS
jgi:hypothetical protein